jgi:hypothetical protein
VIYSGNLHDFDMIYGHAFSIVSDPTPSLHFTLNRTLP